MDDCKKMEMFIESNPDIAMKFILWEQEFYVKENDVDLSSDDITLMPL